METESPLCKECEHPKDKHDDDGFCEYDEEPEPCKCNGYTEPDETDKEQTAE